jgi:predicted DNA-binding antitoxin AbrB/MazE fold protein
MKFKKFKPLKMDLREGSETSANINQTLGIHPKIETVNTEHSESLKSKNFKKLTNFERKNHITPFTAHVKEQLHT